MKRKSINIAICTIRYKISDRIDFREGMGYRYIHEASIPIQIGSLHTTRIYYRKNKSIVINKTIFDRHFKAFT